MRSFSIAWPAVLLPLLSLLIAGCTGSERQADCGEAAQPASYSAQGNLFSNPSFEEGPEPWFSLETEAWGTPFSVSTDIARSGRSSALLQLRSEEPGSESARVYGVVQELSPEDFPQALSGFYCVQRWEQGTPKQYLQVVVIAFDPQNMPLAVASANNLQLRYVLAGVDEQPIGISNARFVMIGTGPPHLGAWTRFERSIRDDFQQLWGVVPEGFAKLRVLFEVRWDDRRPSDGASVADVYYDDLYIGPAEGGD